MIRERTEDFIEAAIQLQKEGATVGVSICHAFKVERVVNKWVHSVGSFNKRCQILKGDMLKATDENIKLLDELWGLSAKHEVVFTTQEKIELYQHFLDESPV